MLLPIIITLSGNRHSHFSWPSARLINIRQLSDVLGSTKRFWSRDTNTLDVVGLELKWLMVYKSRPILLYHVCYVCLLNFTFGGLPMSKIHLYCNGIRRNGWINTYKLQQVHYSCGCMYSPDNIYVTIFDLCSHFVVTREKTQNFLSAHISSTYIQTYMYFVHPINYFAFPIMEKVRIYHALFLSGATRSAECYRSTPLNASAFGVTLHSSVKSRLGQQTKSTSPGRLQFGVIICYDKIKR